MTLWELESWWTPKFLKAIVRAKTHWIEDFLTILESS